MNSYAVYDHDLAREAQIDAPIFTANKMLVSSQFETAPSEDFSSANMLSLLIVSAASIWFFKRYLTGFFEKPIAVPAALGATTNIGSLGLCLMAMQADDSQQVQRRRFEKMKEELLKLASNSSIVPEDIRPRLMQDIDMLVKDALKKIEMIERSGRKTSPTLVAKTIIQDWKRGKTSNTDIRDAAYKRYIKYVNSGAFNTSSIRPPLPQPVFFELTPTDNMSPYNRLLYIERHDMWPGIVVRGVTAGNGKNKHLRTIRGITRDCKLLFEGSSGMTPPTFYMPVDDEKD
ncbi:MAG: hypothetical protein ABH871_04745 [Pseudomonadota bacterium]